MAERVISSDPYHTLDEYFVLRFEGGEQLHPCQEIQYPALQVCIVDNKRINPRRLLIIAGKDDQQINVTTHDGYCHTLNYPGKSAFLDAHKFSFEREVQQFMNKLLHVPSDRRDHLHISTVGAINNVGWRVYWAPLQMTGKLFHVRLVCQSTIDGCGNPSIDDAERLASAFD